MEARRTGGPRRGDLVAGVTVALVLVPQSLAYAEIAGVPPVNGLYTAVAATLAGGIIGSSPYLQTGPVALTSLLTFGALAPLVPAGTTVFAAHAALLALVVGVVRVMLGVLRGGVLAYLMSQPVVVSFTVAAAILILASQVPALVDVQTDGDNPFLAAAQALTAPAGWDPVAIGVGLATIAVILLGRRLSPRFPGALLSTALALGLSALGVVSVTEVGDIPSGLPPLATGLPWGTLGSLVLPGIVIALVGFAEPASIARRYAAEDRQSWDPDKELVGQGLANVASGIFGGYPAGGSFSRSALNRLSGARTRWSGIITGLVVLAVMPVASVLSSLPQAALSGLVIASVISLIEVSPFVETWRFSRPQFVIAVVTFLATLGSAPRVERGLVLGVALSLGLHLWRELQITLDVWDDAGTLHVRPQGVLYFGSAPALETDVMTLVAASPEVRRVVVHLDRLGRVDLTGVLVLRSLIDGMRAGGIQVDVAGTPPQAARLVGAVLTGHEDDQDEVAVSNEGVAGREGSGREVAGADVLAHALAELGAEVVFTVSGNQILPIIESLDAAGIRLVHARHETGAAYMAEAWGRLRGQPGICLVTAGPGHTSVLTGIANAAAAEAPVVLLSGASPRSQRGRGAFQELDQMALAGPVTTRSWCADTALACGETVREAWHHASAGVPGPVLVTLPHDVLGVEAPTDSVGEPGESTDPRAEPVPRLDTDLFDQCMKLLEKARNPVVLLRPCLGRPAAAELLGRLRTRIPSYVVESPRGLADPAWDGCAEEILTADLVLMLGPVDFAVGFGRFADFAAVVQVSSRRAELDAGRRALGNRGRLIHVAENDFLAALVPAVETSLPERAERRATVREAPDAREPMHPLVICDALRPHLQADDLFVIDGGEFGQWMRAGLADRAQCQLINGKLGAIGGAIPHAVGASLAAPERRVFAFLGDGAFGYHAAELDTAVRMGARLVVIVGNDSRWSAEWHAQVRLYGPERTVATDLEERRYDLTAQGYGAQGIAARTRGELERGLDEALATGACSVTCLDVKIRSVPSDARTPV